MMESKAAANHDQKMAMLKANGQSEIDLDAIYKALRGESVKPAEKAKDATVKPDEPITDTKSTEGAIKSSPVKTKSSGSVSLSHIQHTGFDSGDKPVKGIKQLRKTYGDNIPAYLLKDQLDRVWLVSPNENNKVFRKLALVTSEELTQLGVDPNDLVRSTLRNYQNLESLTVSDEALPVSSLKRVYITEANDLSYSYDGAKTVLLDTPEFSVVTNLMNKWATSFLEGYPTLSNDPTIEFENWGEMLSDYSKFISIQKPHNKGSEALDKEFSSEKSVHLDENKPYMIIRGLKFKSSGKVLTPQFIKLDASDFDTARNEEMMNGMKKFLALANKFESLTSTMPDRFRWQNMRIGEYSHVNGVYLMGAFITKLADYHRWLTDSATDKSKSPIMVVDEFEGNGPSLTLFKYALDENKNKVARTDDGNFPPIPLNTLDRLNIDGKTIYELAHELDQMVHGEWDSTKKSYFRVKRNGDTHSLGKTRRYESRLQQLLAEFAASNFAAKLPTGEVVYLRDYVGKNVDAAKSSSGEPVAYKIEFPSLIGPISAEATVELNERDAQGKKQIRNIPKKHKATNPFSKKYFDWLTEVLRDGRTRAENYGIEVPLLEENEHLKRKLVPLKALNTIFGTKEGTFDHLNNGFGVREPLNDNLYSGKNLPALNGALKTNFNGVIPATMSISLTVEDSSLRPEASDLEIPAEDLSKPPLPFEFDEVTTSNVQDDEELDIALRKSVEKDLGRTISPKEAFKLFDRWLKTKSTPRTWKLSTVMSKLTTDSQIKKDCK